MSTRRAVNISFACNPNKLFITKATTWIISVWYLVKFAFYARCFCNRNIGLFRSVHHVRIIGYPFSEVKQIPEKS